MSTLQIILLVIGIHLFELFIFFGYRLISKNNKLYKIVDSQQQYIDAISIIIKNSNDKLEELDSKGAFKSDDEVGVFFTNLQSIQEVLNEFNVAKSKLV